MRLSLGAMLPKLGGPIRTPRGSGKKYKLVLRRGNGELNPQPEKTLSIFRMIASAHWTLAEINLSERGLPIGPPNKSSAVCMCRLARIAVIIPSTLFRPSSMPGTGANFTQRLRWVTS